MSWTLNHDKQTQAVQAYEAGEARYDRVRPYAGDDASFGVYLAVCDQVCLTIAGVGIFDIADYAWRDAYDDATAPRAAVREALGQDDVFRHMVTGNG